MIQMKKKSQAVVIISIIGLLIAILLTILVLVPQFSHLKELSDTANAKQEELRLGREKVQSIKAAVTLIANSKKEIDALGVAIPKSPEAESALVQVSSAASAAGVSISSVSVTDDGKGGLQISVSTTGPYDKTMDFVAKIETNLRPTQLSDVTINSVEGGDLNATFNLSFPYLEAKSATSPVAGSADQTTATDGEATNTGAL